jgi:hypothetical protein
MLRIYILLMITMLPLKGIFAGGFYDPVEHLMSNYILGNPIEIQKDEPLEDYLLDKNKNHKGGVSACNVDNHLTGTSYESSSYRFMLDPRRIKRDERDGWLYVPQQLFIGRNAPLKTRFVTELRPDFDASSTQIQATPTGEFRIAIDIPTACLAGKEEKTTEEEDQEEPETRDVNENGEVTRVRNMYGEWVTLASWVRPMFRSSPSEDEKEDVYGNGTHPSVEWIRLPERAGFVRNPLATKIKNSPYESPEVPVFYVKIKPDYREDRAETREEKLSSFKRCVDKLYNKDEITTVTSEVIEGFGSSNAFVIFQTIVEDLDDITQDDIDKVFYDSLEWSIFYRDPNTYEAHRTYAFVEKVGKVGRKKAKLSTGISGEYKTEVRSLSLNEASFIRNVCLYMALVSRGEIKDKDVVRGFSEYNIAELLVNLESDSSGEDAESPGWKNTRKNQNRHNKNKNKKKAKRALYHFYKGIKSKLKKK